MINNKNNEKKVSIILVNYKGTEDTLACIKSLEEIEYENYEIIIVDNASPDNSLKELKKALSKKHTIIASDKNNGFAYGNNIGINYALQKGTEYVLLLNNDTTVERNFLQKLINTIEKEDNIGIATGCILNYYNKDTIWFGGGVINWQRFYGQELNKDKKFSKTPMKEEAITFATGCLMLIKAEVFEKCGLLPEEYFMYYEDVDYCASVQDKGYKIMYNPQSIIYHKIGASSGEGESPFAIEWNTRNRLRFMKRYKNKVSLLKYIKIKLFFYLTRVIKLLQYIAKGRMDKAKALIKGCKL